MSNAVKADSAENSTLHALRLRVAQLEADNATHRQVKKVLERERNQLRTLIDAMPDYIYFKDTESRFINANLSAAHWVGANAPADLIARNDFDFHPPAVAMQYYTEDQTVLNTGQPVLGKEVLAAKTGENEVWHSHTKLPFIDNNGEVTGIVGIIHDISERKQTEKSITKANAELNTLNAELERANRLKDEFLASMSHELRTPLNAVLGMAEILLEGVYGELNEVQRRKLNIIQSSGRHLLSLINDILDLSKVEAGKLDLQTGQASVIDLCQSSLQFIKETALKQQIKTYFAFDNRVKYINVDERRLKQILVNLLSNAVKFTREGGEVGLDVETDEAEGLIRFTVWDTGIGIKQEDMEHLFKPFSQIDSSLSRQHGGTGLGLALVHRLTEMHGGNVTLKSEGISGKGSRFTVSLPWRKTPDDETGKDAKPGPVERRHSVPHKSCKVLLAEDNESNVETVKAYLEIFGYYVLVAENGLEAVKIAGESKPAIALIDIQMPVMDGLEAIRHIRANEKTATMPIIALTALAMPEDRQRCLQAGANRYVSKPFSLVDLGSVIQQLLQQPETQP